MINDLSNGDWTSGDGGGDTRLDDTAYPHDLRDLPEAPDLIDASDAPVETDPSLADLPEVPDLLGDQDDPQTANPDDNPDKPTDIMPVEPLLPEAPNVPGDEGDPVWPDETPDDDEPTPHAGDNRFETGPNTPEGEPVDERPVIRGQPIHPEGRRPGGIEGGW